MNPISHSMIPDKGFIRSNPDQLTGPRMSDTDNPSRITVIEHVIYNVKSNQPHVIANRFSRNQMTEEQAYKRQIVIGTEWTKLEPNWIKVCGMMIINNEEGKYKQRIPTPDERAEVNSHILEVFFGLPGQTGQLIEEDEDKVSLDQWTRSEELRPATKTRVQLTPWAMLLLPPGESQRYTPKDINNIWLRCQNGTAKIIITLIPG